MDVSDFKFEKDSRLKMFDQLLNQLYGIKIDWEAPESYLESVLAHYQDRKKTVLAEGACAMQNPEYAKSVLITEAIRVYLREIAPVRRKKSRRPQ